MPPCLTLSIIRYGSRVKWSNPGKGVAPSPTPWCSKLSKREPSGHPRLWSTTIFTYKFLDFLYTFIWYQVFLSNTNNLNIVVWLLVFLVNTNNNTFGHLTLYWGCTIAMIRICETYIFIPVRKTFIMFVYT